MTAPLERPDPTKWFFLVGITLVVVWALFLVFLLLIVPKFEESFRDFGVALPWLSIKLIECSRYTRGVNPGQSIPGWLAAPLCLPAIGAIAWGASRCAQRVARLIFILVILAGVLLLGGGLASMLLPTSAVQRSLNQGV